MADIKQNLNKKNESMSTTVNQTAVPAVMNDYSIIRAKVRLIARNNTIVLIIFIYK